MASRFNPPGTLQRVPDDPRFMEIVISERGRGKCVELRTLLGDIVLGTEPLAEWSCVTMWEPPT